MDTGDQRDRQPGIYEDDGRRSNVAGEIVFAFRQVLDGDRPLSVDVADIGKSLHPE
jgi:hypothetical protein